MARRDESGLSPREWACDREKWPVILSEAKDPMQARSTCGHAGSSHDAHDFARHRDALNMSPVANESQPAEVLSEGWDRLPAAYAIPSAAPSLKEAQAYCRHLARTHYENFSVATWFLPKKLRQDFFNVYAYCRISDDLGDEVGDANASLTLLDQWQSQLDACYEGDPRHPVFVALAETVRKFDIPKHEFSDLLIAFRQDQTVTRFPTFDDVLAYCRYSANPVGHLVLYLCGYHDAERQQLSDYTCTALQLANFWQDVTRRLRQGTNLSAARRLAAVFGKRGRHPAEPQHACVLRDDEV